MVNWEVISNPLSKFPDEINKKYNNNNNNIISIIIIIISIITNINNINLFFLTLPVSSREL